MGNEYLTNTPNNVLTEEERKEEELLQTIKMEPILETTELTEEESVKSKKRKLKLADFLLVLAILILLGVFLFIIFKLA